MTALSTLSASVKMSVNWTAQLNQTGSDYQPVSSASTVSKSQSLGNSVGNTESGGADMFYSFQQGITAGSSATIDLNAMTDILQRSSQAIVRIKGILVRLLSGEDDSTISPTPSTSSKICVTNNGPTLPSEFGFGNGGSGLTLALTTSAGAITGVSIGAAGSGYPPSSTFLVAPVQTSGSAGLVAVTTNGSGVPTSVAVTAGGSGYSDATVPSVVAGAFYLNNGGILGLTDQSANGFCSVSSTVKNIKIFNLDGTNAVTFQLTVIGGSD